MNTPPIVDKFPIMVRLDLGLTPPHEGDWLYNHLGLPYIPQGRDTFLALVPNRYRDRMK